MYIFDFSKCELIALASTISIALSKEFTQEELSILSGFFSAIGDNLTILSS